MRGLRQHFWRDVTGGALTGEIPARELLDATLDSIVVYEFEDGSIPTVTYANKAAAETRGYRRDELLGKALTDLIVPEDHKRIPEHLEVLVKHGHLAYETLHRRKDGSTFPVEVRVSLLRSNHKHVAVAVYRDISESLALRSELDGALQRALGDRSQLRTMMDVLPVGMALVGPGAEVLEVNRTNELIWRTRDHPKPPELEGYSVFRGWNPKTGEPYGPSDWPVADVLRTGEPVYDRLVEIERFDGSRGFVEISAIPIKDESGQIQSMVVLTIDVTDRERRERLALALDDLNLEIHSTFDRERILDRVLRRTVATYEASYGMIVTIDGAKCLLDRYVRLPQKLDDRVPYLECKHGMAAVATGHPVFVEDVGTSTEVAAEARESGVGSIIVIPLLASEGPTSVMEIGFDETRAFNHTDRDFARKVGDFASFALDNARLYGELAKSIDAMAERDVAIRQAYSDVIEAVTGGRLVLLDTAELSDEMVPDAEPRMLIDDPANLSVARALVRQRLADKTFKEDLVLAFGEALNNALKYAGEATYGLNMDSDRVQLVVSDTGPGIDFGNLPKATLMSGFSTKHTLGVGFTLMMELTDRVLLCTGEQGTTVVLEHDLNAA